MIANVAPKKGGSAEKEYKISADPMGFNEERTAIPGSYVNFKNEGFTLKGNSTGNTIPYKTGNVLTRAPSMWCYFVMPAEDVIIS